jgi:hypothetical protein
VRKTLDNVKLFFIKLYDRIFNTNYYAKYNSINVISCKVKSVKVRIKPECNNKVMDIMVYFKSGKSASYSGNLSNHKMPIKYRNYIATIMKEVK